MLNKQNKQQFEELEPSELNKCIRYLAFWCDSIGISTK